MVGLAVAIAFKVDTEAKKEGATGRTDMPKASLRRARSNEVSLQGVWCGNISKVERSKSSTNNTTWKSSGCTLARWTQELLHKLSRTPSSQEDPAVGNALSVEMFWLILNPVAKLADFHDSSVPISSLSGQ